MFKVAEKEAFQLLYSSYYETLVLFANQIIDDSQAAEDIVQDCLVKFWISKRYRTLESGLDKYIFQAVKFSSLNYVRGDNMGYSHYYAEVLRVKQVAEEVAKGKNLVVVFDELFKGTNVKDAYDATVSVTEAFSMNRNCTFIISTHIIEDISSSCNQVVVINKGELKYFGDPSDMVEMANGKVWQFNIDKTEFEKVLDKSLVIHHIQEGDTIRVRYLSVGQPYEGAVEVEANLEDAYLCLLKNMN